MGMHQYFKRLSRFRKINKIPGRNLNILEHNVAAHSFKVTKIAQYMLLSKNIMEIKSIGRVSYEKSLNHDFAEVFAR